MGNPLSQRSPTQAPKALDSIKECGQYSRQACTVVSETDTNRLSLGEIIHPPIPEPTSPGALFWPCQAHAVTVGSGRQAQNS